MSYFCETPGCLFNLKKWAYPVSGNCPECGQPFVLKVEFDSFEKDVINNYPYVIAFPFKRMLEETQFFTKFSLLKDVFVNTLKYNALLVATEYFKSPYKSEVINTLFINKLSRPFHGDWNQFLEVAIDFLEQNNYSFFVRELPFAYHSIETGKKNNLVKRYEISKIFTNHSGRIQTEKKELTAIRALLYYRNEMMAHRQTLNNDTFKKLYYTCYIILKDFLQAISFCKDYPMYKADRLYYWSLMGTEVKQAGRLTTPVSKDDNVWIQDINGNRLSLLPFFVQPSQYIAGTNDAMQVLMYEGNTGPHGRIIFDSPESFKPEAEGEIVSKFYELLQVKRILYSHNEKDFTKEKLKLEIDKQNRKVFKELKGEQKLIEGIYQKREEAEVSLLSWVGVKAGLFFLAADAGAGKTNLLWEIQRQYSKREINTLFIRASRFKEDDLSLQLIYLFHLIDGFSYSNCEAFAFTQDKPLIILIDGGNETANSEKLLKSIQAFLQQFIIGTVKVVISWRINTQNDVPKFDEYWGKLYYNANFTTNPNNDLQKRHYWLPPLNKGELQRVWDNYVQHPTKTKYRVLFTLDELTIADKPLVDQLHNPLLLKIFLELYSGKELSSMPKGFTNIWAIWWNRNIAKKPTTSTFLINLAVLMANNQANRISLNSLYEDQDIGQYIRNYQIDNPYQQLLNSNVLTQFSIDNKLYVTFTIESVFHFALCQFLLQNPNTESSLADCAAKGHQWQEALLFYLWDAVNKQKIELIISVLKNSEIPDSIFIKPLANAFLLVKTNKILDAILTNSDNRTWKILHKAVEYIDKAQYKRLVNTIVQTIRNQIDLSQPNCVAFVARYLRIFDKEFAINVANQIANTFIVNEIRKNDLEILRNLACYYEYVGLFDKAKTYYQINLELSLQIYGEKHLQVAASYGNIASILKVHGKYDEAMDYYQKELDIKLKFYEGEHPDIAISYDNIASILKIYEKYDEAMDYFQKGAFLRYKFYGFEHPKIAISIGNIGSILEIQGKYEEAALYSYVGLGKKLRFYGEEDPEIATLITNLAHVCEKVNGFEGALEFYDTALQIKIKSLPNNHPDIAIINRHIADIYTKQGLIEKSLPHLLTAEKIFKQHFEKSHPKVADLDNSFGLFYEKKGELNRALTYYQKAYQKKLNILGADNSEVRVALENIKRIEIFL